MIKNVKYVIIIKNKLRRLNNGRKKRHFQTIEKYKKRK